MTRALTSIIAVFGLALTLALSGCGMLGGADRHDRTVSDYYNQYLPTVRQIHHPDTVRADDDTSFRQLIDAWSVNHTVRTGRRDFGPGNYSSFATLWSRELSIRSAEIGLGLGDVTADVRSRALDQQMERYDEVLAFEVHLFVPVRQGYTTTDTQLRASGMHIVLQDDRGNEYRPIRVDSDAPEEFQVLPSERPVYHRINRLYFERRPDDIDILENVESLRLVVRTAGTRTDEIWFTWRFQS
jgi:hypothetical protein